MLRPFYPVIWILTLHALFLVDSMKINTSEHVPLPWYNQTSFIRQESTLADSINNGNSSTIPSRSQDLPCPASEDISPCRCFYSSSEHYMDMDCSSVSTEAELRRVFAAYFPVTHFRRLEMRDCQFSILESGVFGDVTFTGINIEMCELQEVANGALDGMYDTLEELNIFDTRIQQFPFETIEKFTKLNYMAIDTREDFTCHFPVIKSESLKVLRLELWNFDYMPIDALNGLSAIEEIYLFNAGIPDIEPGTFSNLTHLRVLDLDANRLTQIKAGTFPFNDGMNNITWLRVGSYLEKIEVNAFGVKHGVTIDVSYNNLAIIDKEVWKPLFDVEIDLDISNNPLLCGCDIAWIVRNPDYLDQIQKYAKCSDGENIHDLDPHIFDWC